MDQSHTLRDQLATFVKHGDHLCVICEDPHQRLQAAVQYIADGLRRNEFVMYAADAETTEELSRALTLQGIDVEHEISRGALSLPTADEAYLRDGEFNPDVIYQAFDQAITDALDAGFSGCRFAGEPVWAIDRESLRPGLIEFEKQLNELFRSRKAAGLCVYDKKAWPTSVVRDVLRTHPIAVIDDRVCKHNLYYEWPDLREKPTADFQVDWMLSQLREMSVQEARLQVALEAGKLGSWELNLRDDTSTRSIRHDQIFGYDHPLPQWGFKTFLQHVLPEDRPQVEGSFHQAIERGETWQFACRIRRANDGCERWIEAHGRPYPEGSRGSRVERLLGIVADISERKELEHGLLEADKRKDEFLATLAHELRNPLAPIQNSLQLIELKTFADPQLKQVQSIINRQVQHLVRLVDDLLDVSRITSGRIVLQTEVVELHTILASALEASQPVIEAFEHKLFVSVPETAAYLKGDETRLSQVFLNLLNNAAKYTPKGGRIELTASLEAEHAVVRIRDNGQGIAPDRIADMFKMFVQGNRTRENQQPGLGIGLPLAKQLVELHGGTIEAYSKGEGQGSVLSVRLPLTAIEEVKKNSSAPPADSISWKRILIVDDNVDAADTLALSLKSFGHETATRYDAISALEALNEFKPDIAILDIGLPDMSGYELAKRFKKIKPDILLAALTGWGQEKDKLLACEAGFDIHRTKPVHPDELLSALAMKEKQEA